MDKEHEYFISTFATFGNPHGFTRLFWLTNNKNITNKIKTFDLDTNAIKLLPKSKIYSIRKELIENRFVISYSIYTYAKEKNSTREGTFIGSSIIFIDKIAEENIIVENLNEIHNDLSKKITKNNIITVGPKEFSIIRPRSFDKIKSHLKEIDNLNLNNQTTETLLIYCRTENPNRLQTLFKESIRLLNIYDSIYFTESKEVAEFVKNKNIFIFKEEKENLIENLTQLLKEQQQEEKQIKEKENQIKELYKEMENHKKKIEVRKNNLRNINKKIRNITGIKNPENRIQYPTIDQEEYYREEKEYNDTTETNTNNNKKIFNYLNIKKIILLKIVILLLTILILCYSPNVNNTDNPIKTEKQRNNNHLQSSNNELSSTNKEELEFNRILKEIGLKLVINSIQNENNKDITADEIVTIIFNKHPKDIGEQYRDKKEIYTKELIKYNPSFRIII